MRASLAWALASGFNLWSMGALRGRSGGGGEDGFGDLGEAERVVAAAAAKGEEADLVQAQVLP